MTNLIARSVCYALAFLLLSFLHACTSSGGDDDVSPLQAPTIAPIAQGAGTPVGELTAEEGEELTFTVDASNEGPAPVLSASELPPGANFNTDSGDFSWIPAQGDARSEPYEVTFTATDPIETGLSSSQTVRITVLPFGSGTFTAIAPVISPDGGSFLDSVTVSMTTGSEGATIFYTLDGSDPTESSNQYVEPFTLTESATVNARAFRGDLNTSNLSRAIFTVTRNELPVLDPIGDKSINEQETLSFVVTASDAESTPLLSVSELPPGAIFDPATGQFEWTPEPGAGANSPYAVTFTARDGDNPFLIATETISITVNNEAPVLSAIGNRSVAENELLSFTVRATDAESTPVLSASGLPAGASFDAASGTFSWTPAPGTAGGSPYTVTFTATDEIDPGLTDSETVQITVSNDAPVLDPIGDQVVTVGQPLTFTVTASDTEAPPVLSVTELPTGALFAPETGVFSYTPLQGAENGSPYQVTFTATDAVDPNLTASETISITVQPFIFTPPSVATPTITPPGGTFDDSVTVTIATATPGASIFYTLNNSDPTQGSTPYSAPFAVTVDGTIVSARAFRGGLADSARATSAPFNINTVTAVSCTTAITSPAAGTLQTSTNLRIDADFSCTPEIPPGWGVRLTAVGADGASAAEIERFTPYTRTYSLPRDEYTLTATVVDDLGNTVTGAGAAQDQVNRVGIGAYYVAIGDSITFGVGDNITGDNTSGDGRNTGGGYTPILNNLLTEEEGYPHTVINAGVQGDFAIDGLQALPGVLSRHAGAQTFLVMYGMNDANPARLLPPTPSGLGLNPGDGGYAGSFKDTMQQMVNRIVSAGKEAVVARINIALGDSATGVQYPDPENGARSVLIQEYNEVISDELSNITVGPNFFSYYLNNPGQYSDNIHPNGVGYQNMADRWRRRLD